MWKAGKQTFRTERRGKKEYKRRILYSGLATLSVGLIAVLVWYGARRPEVTITSIAVDGGSTVPHEIIREKAESALSGTYALLIPKRFSLLIPREALLSAVNSIPRVHDASVVRSSRNELKVSFKEYVPYALWCEVADVHASGTPGTCLFVDDRGYAFAAAPQLSGETLVRFMVEERAPTIGEYVYDTATLSRYRQLVAGISEVHEDRLRAMTETGDGDLVLHVSQGPDLMIAKNADVRAIFENLESILASDEYKKIPLEEFEYIDLRFGNKVYVKRKGVEVPALPESLGSSTESGQ